MSYLFSWSNSEPTIEAIWMTADSRIALQKSSEIAKLSIRTRLLEDASGRSCKVQKEELRRLTAPQQRRTRANFIHLGTASASFSKEWSHFGQPKLITDSQAPSSITQFKGKRMGLRSLDRFMARTNTLLLLFLRFP